MASDDPSPAVGFEVHPGDSPSVTTTQLVKFYLRTFDGNEIRGILPPKTSLTFTLTDEIEVLEVTPVREAP